jgi:hypothetical protein
MPQPEGAELEARRRLDQAGIEYPGPDRGVDDSLYFRSPSGFFTSGSCTRGASHRAAGDQVRCPISLGCR